MDAREVSGRGGCRPLDARPDDIDRYRDECLSAGSSPATVSRRLSGIASFFRYAAAQGRVDDNPADGVERPEPGQGGTAALGADELAPLLDAAEALGPKTAALVHLLALDGMRLGEVLAIDVPRIHKPCTVTTEITRGVSP